MRLLLSGGSHRATLGALGAIGYFLWSDQHLEPGSGNRPDRWSDIDEIVSVSGGSLLNASLAGHTSTVHETQNRLKEIRRRLVSDGLLPHKTIRRSAITLTAVMVVVALVWVLLAAFGVVGPDVLSESPWSVLIALAILPATITAARRLGGAYQRDFLNQIIGNSNTAVESVVSTQRHIICSSGLASGLPYYFTIGGDPFEPMYGTALDTGYTLGDAVAASTALPGLGRVRAPQELRREVLVDGGVSGGFGEQVSTTIRRRPQDTWRSDGEWFAVDAVRHLMSDSKLNQLAQSVSMLALLGRWLKVSLEATYVNDLLDLGPGQYARVWSQNILPPPPPDPATTFRDGSAPSRPAEDVDSPERRKLKCLQKGVGRMGLHSLRREHIDLGIVVGFVSTLEVRHRLEADEVKKALCWLDGALGADGQLLEVWTGSDSTTKAG